MPNFLLTISPVRIKISRNGKRHRVRLVNALLMICGMTHFVTPGSSRDLDLRSNFQVDLSRSKSIPLDASRREEHDGATDKSVSLLDQKL